MAYRCVSNWRISIHALREEGDICTNPFVQLFVISIHALREEGDRYAIEDILLLVFISIHALREEGDHMDIYYFNVPCNFYPRPPRGGRPLSGDKTSS